MTLRPAEYQVVCRRDSRSFMHRAFRALNRVATFFENWHYELIASKLQACLGRQSTKLIINLLTFLSIVLVPSPGPSPKLTSSFPYYSFLVLSHEQQRNSPQEGNSLFGFFKPQFHEPFQGSRTSRPQSSKSATLRVASLAPRTWAMAAICASAWLIGLPSARR